MLTTPFESLACPLDGHPLTRHEGALRCPAGHSFDIAKQGHVNLLPVQQKRSTDPGDSKAMVAARQRFLSAGYYQGIADAVSAAVFEGVSNEPLRCLDAGCGEGYYLRALAASAGEVALERVGLDISKWAVLQAAKQSRGDDKSGWLVGSNANLPLQDGTIDRLLCMFGFPVVPEFSRVLVPGGVWLQVEAGPDHLRELRDIIYPRLKPEREGEPETPAGFNTRGVETIRYSVTLEDQSAIGDLLAMTPHLYRASVEGRTRAQALETLTVTVDVRVIKWVKEG
ncbi:putative RNA methyltransferase [Vreelandella sp. TE19]